MSSLKRLYLSLTIGLLATFSSYSFVVSGISTGIYIESKTAESMAVSFPSTISVGDAANWVQAFPASSPSPRAYTPLAYDSSANVTIMFGGQSSSGSPLGDTWQWDGMNWTQLFPDISPSPRRDHAMTYDSQRNRVVLFAGFDGGWPADTWEWDGSHWEKKNPVTRPPGSTGAVMTYDTLRQKIVLFGGFTSDFIAETWEWDGSNWSKKTGINSPPARAHAGMVFDSTRGKVVLFGGYSSLGKLNDTWEWDGTNWVKSTPSNSPTARARHSMAYNSLLGKTVLLGGETATGLDNQTWLWDGNNWTQIATTNSPLPRYIQGSAYNSHNNQVVVFGGRDSDGFLNDTWLLKSLRITVDPASTNVIPGANADFTIKAEGLTSPVSLTTSDLPDGIAKEFIPGAMITPPGQSNLSLSVPSSVPDSLLSITIIGQAEGLSASTQVNLAVVTPDFSLLINPTPQTIYQEQSGEYLVYTNAIYGFSQMIHIDVTGLEDVPYTISPNPVQAGETATLTVSPDLNTSVRPYNFNITGTYEALSHSSSAMLNVLQAAIGLSTQPTSSTIYRGQSINFVIDSTATPGFTHPINLSVSNLNDIPYMFAPISILPGQASVLHLVVPSTVLPGSRVVNISASSEGLSDSISVTLIIKAQVFLPNVLKNWTLLPFMPVLSPIHNLDGGNYHLYWSEGSIRHADTYLVQESTTVDFSTAVVEVCNTYELYCPITGKGFGTYYYRVRGHNNQLGDGEWSNTQIAIVLPPDTPMLNSIDNADGDGIFIVAWSSTLRTTSYLLEESTTSDFSSPIARYVGSQTFWSTTNQLAGTYYYRVSAMGPTGQSNWSSSQSAVVLLPDTPILQSIDNADKDGFYTVAWNATARTTNYSLEESTNQDFAGTVNVYIGSSISWEANDKLYQTYYYRVKAIGPTGESVWSNTQSVVVPDPPSGVSVMSNHTTYVKSSYRYVVGEIYNNTSSYIRFTKINVSFFQGNQIVATDYSYVDLDNIHPGEKACFKIILNNSFSWSSYNFDGVTYWTDGTPRPNLVVTSYNGYVNSGYYRLIGQIRNDETIKVSFVKAVATFYDNKKKVLDCDYSYVSTTDLTPQQVSSFSIYASPLSPSAVSSYVIQTDGDK